MLEDSNVNAVLEETTADEEMLSKATLDNSVMQEAAADKEQQFKQVNAVSKFHLLTLEELLTIQPPTWLIDGHIAQDTLCEIYGDSEVGKSFIALDMACSIASGTPWLGWDTKQGSVIYIAAEGVAGMAKRAKSWQKSHGIDVDKGKLLFLGEAAQITEARERQELLNAIDYMKVKPALIVIDTLARCAVGVEENSAKEMGLFVDGCEQIRAATGATVLIVHHTNRNGKERGSISLKNACFTQMYVSKGKSYQIKIECAKMKDFAHFEDIFAKLVVDEVNDSCYIVASDGTGHKSAPTLTKSQQKLLEVIKNIWQGKNLSTAQIKEASGIDRNLYNLLKQLIGSGFLSQPERGFYRLELQDCKTTAQVPIAP